MESIDKEIGVFFNGKHFAMSSSLWQEVPSISFERKLSFPTEKDWLKSVDQEKELLFNEKHVAMDVNTNWWAEKPSVSFEKKG